ncbi:MAG: L-seryl-tRNA(Sec) selenium transferase [Deltaproteobacteria bacterium]|nr:L-seryl-tRNA(Sec) selenium transferase [Deltaproteobacteria bacterium]
MNRDLLRKLPAVDYLLRDTRVSDYLRDNPRRLVADAVRIVLEEEREYIKKSGLKDYQFNMEAFMERVRAQMEKIGRPSLVRVVNATGVILHTNLGRAPLAEAALKSLADASLHYTNLEFDIEKGERGERYTHVEEDLCRLTGAESAVVVNNNAAAVLLVLNTIAEGKEVVVSRGELVEIGGSFRIPDVMRKSGARLVEVGTTNRTHIRDYESAVTQETALILKVHKSNFDLIGFTAEVSFQDLAELGGRSGIPLMNDLGSGSLIDLSRFGMKKEPTVQDAVKSGVDVVTFSGDKLLGGPQAGIIVGKKKIIDAVKKNPLTRALRVDKLTVAALEATLRIYRDELRAVKEIPILNMLTKPLSELTKKGKKLVKVLRGISRDRFEIIMRDGCSQVGGGALPLQEIPTKLVAVRPKLISVNQLERLMRMNQVPIISRIERDEVVFDIRTLMDGDIEIVVDFFKGASIE